MGLRGWDGDVEMYGGAGVSYNLIGPSIKTVPDDYRSNISLDWPARADVGGK